MQLCEVYDDARKAGARIYAYPIGFADAATIEFDGSYGIFVDVARARNWRQLSWQLAHEVGHCATGCTHKVSSPYDLIARHEYKADRWAITRYLGVERLRRAMAEGYTEPWQLAEYFNLPQKAVEQALALLDRVPWCQLQCGPGGEQIGSGGTVLRERCRKVLTINRRRILANREKAGIICGLFAGH